MGRAGRDGREARCVAFLDDADFRTLRSLAHGDGVDAPAVAGFLAAAFADPPPPRAAAKTKATRGKKKVHQSCAGMPAVLLEQLPLAELILCCILITSAEVCHENAVWASPFGLSSP